MKDLWIAQLQSAHGLTWASAPWDGNGVLALGHPLKWVIQKSAGAQKFKVRFVGSEVGKLYRAPVLELPQQANDWLDLPQLEAADGSKIRLVSLAPKAVPQFGHLGQRDWTLHSDEHLKRPMQWSLATVLALTAILAFWPKPPSEIPAEVMPSQIAKIVLQKRSKVAAAGATGSPGTVAQSQSKAPLKQAMQSAAFQKSVSKLLSTSGFRQMASTFSGSLPSLQKAGSLSGQEPLASATGPAVPGVQVASLGGAGIGGGIGYGKGGHATVGGQGNGQVLLDLDSSFVEEGLTRDEVGKVIHSHIAEIRYCYESSMIHQPNVEGRIQVSFSIGANGQVKESSIHDSTVKDPRLDQCLLKRLNQWAFPKPKGGVTVAVTYPFIFKSLER